MTDGTTACHLRTRGNIRVQNALDQLKRQTQTDPWRWRWLGPEFLHTGQRAKIEVEVECSTSGTGTVRHQSLLFILQIVFIDGQGFNYRVNSSVTTHLYGLRNDDQILSVNGMFVTGLDPIFVSQLLNFLAKTKSFNLVIRGERTESNKYFILSVNIHPAESRGVVEEIRNGWDFRKDLELMPGSFKIKDCYLVHNHTDLCVVTDGHSVQLETMHGKLSSVISTWQYDGNENDPRSLHYRKRQTVFGFKLKHSNSDLSKCLGVAHNHDDLILLDADIPDHGPILKTKIDSRFFYCTFIPATKCMMFESTIFEEYYLAVREVERDNSRKPTLYLKNCPSRRGVAPQDKDILFKCVIKHNGSLSQESVESASNGTTSPILCDQLCDWSSFKHLE